MTINIQNIYIYLFSTLLLLSINLPTVYKEIKILILALLMLIVIHKIFKNKFHLNKNIAFLTLMSLLFSGLFFFNGLINNNPGAFPSTTVFILWPIVYIFLIGANNSIDFFKYFDNILLFSSYFIPIYGVYFLLGTASIIPDTFFINVFPVESYIGIGIGTSSVSVSIINFSSILFLAPFVFTKFVLSSDRKTTLVYIISLFLLIGIILLSGRRALMVILIFALLLIYLFSFFMYDNKSKRIIRQRIFQLMIFMIIFTMLVFSIVMHYHDIDPYLIVENLIEGFSFGGSKDESTQLRTEQFFSLIDGWQKAPFFGNGLGAVASVVRDSTQPWAYELTYISLLFQTGIVGILFYGLLILYVIFQSTVMLNDKNTGQFALPYLIGMLSFLIGNSSNPYLFKFDYMWVIFLPIMLINHSKLQKKSRN